MSQHVLVTGFPRMIAMRVTDAVLATRPNAQVSLLVREKFVDRAKRIVDRSPHCDRITLLTGDCASIDLGLSGDEWRAMSSKITHIQHHAFVSYEGADDRTAEALNIDGTREVLEFARACVALQRLIVHSTATVSGDRTGTVFEDELELGQRFRTHIERTRFRAERLVRREMDALPITILRPGLIVGDSQTGEIDRFDGPYMLILLLLSAPSEFSLPLPVRGDAPLNLVPIDFVARAAAALHDDPKPGSRTVHLVDPAPLPARRIYDVISRAAGHKLSRGFIPANITRAVLRTPGLERVLRSPRAFVEQLATDVTYDSRTARAMLAPHAVECPPFEQYAEVLVRHVRERLAARRSENEESELIEDPLA
ncbi:MAG: SDR family oxidoreductase [Deltaproteobacteria bacterium]|nr:SDR family oxidoreductase [Deltaproteobacteria bacterium]